MAVSDKLLEQINEIQSRLGSLPGADKLEIDTLIEIMKGELDTITAAYEEADERRRFYNAQVCQQYGIIDALAEDYSAIYVLARDNQYIIPIKRQTNWDRIEQPEGSDWGYNEKLKTFIDSYAHPDDQKELYGILEFDNLVNVLEQQGHFYHHFRMMQGDTTHYYYIKVSQVKSTENNLDAVMIGLICEDDSKEREALKTLSETDIMTGLYNRGTGEKKTREFITNGVVGMFCMMDMDHFKTINDTCGHAVGDEVIISFAKTLRDSFRNEDIVFRLGGDEFAVFAPGIVSRQVGMRILKEFVGRINEIKIPELQRHNIDIEVSIGAVISGGTDCDFESTYDKADSCVYISKRGSGSSITFRPDIECIIV